jgi:hypothetical protein
MGALTDRFFAYALDFEKTFVDDDWSRVEPYFEPDAVYEVKNTSFDCRLEGVAAILRGMKKSIDGLDRRCASRTIEGTDGPTEEGDTVSVGWSATYTKEGAPPFVLRGRSKARYRGQRIAHLVDEYPDGMDEEATEWIRRYAPDLSASYV